jgi:hypothetical protein
VTTFTKNCSINISGKAIGEANNNAYTYSWTPTTGLSNAAISNPTANPANTTTYTLRKTHIASGCYDDDEITVTVNTPTITAVAGTAFTKDCSQNTSGKAIGEADDNNYTYSWTPTTGLSNAAISNPTANPDITTTYTVRKTHKTSGCYDDDEITVTVNKPTITAAAGDDFTKNCTINVSGKAIGEATNSDYTYSWTPTAGLK